MIIENFGKYPQNLEPNPSVIVIWKLQYVDRGKKSSFENIQAGKVGNFRRFSSNAITDLGAPYDYCSIMHYSARAFSKNGKDTITTIKPTNGCVIGETPYEKDTLSEIDMRKLNTYYQCKGLPQISTPGKGA